jgi:hypothetical protein
VSICALIVAVVLAGSGAMSQAQSYKHTAPESFRANAQATSGGGGGTAAAFNFQVDAYTPDADRAPLLAALGTGGSAAFVEALKKGKVIGYIEAGAGGGRKVNIRYAREQATAKGGRKIVLVTDAPVYFVGGGALDAKPTAGYDVAVIEFEVDVVGLGSGTMAAAAKVKAGGTAGVQIDDYAQQPIKLVTVTREAAKSK